MGCGKQYSNSNTRRPSPTILHAPRPPQYLAWTHAPHSYAASRAAAAPHAAGHSATLFATGFLEYFSRTAPTTVILMWLPLVAALWAPYLRGPDATLVSSAAILACGVGVWTLVEWSLHKFLFHADARLPDSPLLRTAHFLLHGVHHKFPTDRGRLVMPPFMLAPLAAAVYVCFRLLLPIESGVIGWAAWHALFGAGLLGYILYDITHYCQHHAALVPGSYLWRMRRVHMQHHFGPVPDVGFGITSSVWDHAFGTAVAEDGEGDGGGRGGGGDGKRGPRRLDAGGGSGQAAVVGAADDGQADGWGGGGDGSRAKVD